MCMYMDGGGIVSSADRRVRGVAGQFLGGTGGSASADSMV